MGDEVICVATYRNQTSSGKALLETDYLLFRGNFRVRIGFADVRSVDIRDGGLTLHFADDVATFELGRRAEDWARKIRSPKPLLDKLGVKPEHRVTVLGFEDEAFVEDLRMRARDTTADRRKRSRDIVFFCANSADDLRAVPSIEALLSRSGSLWVVYPRGRKTITEGDVLGAGRAAGLVDVKVARFSDTHTALKFVIPAQRR